MKCLSKGFTIIELLVVIVVIGILTGIVILSYGSLTNNTYKTTQQGDLRSGASKLESYRSEKGKYPSTLAELIPTVLKSSDGSAYTYLYDAATDTYCLSLASSRSSLPSQKINKDAAISDGICVTAPSYALSSISQTLHSCLPGWPSYSFNYSSVTGTGVTYSVTSGALPASGTLNTSTGVVSGTAANVNATYNFVIRATNAGGSADETVALQEYHNVCP